MPASREPKAENGQTKPRRSVVVRDACRGAPSFIRAQPIHRACRWLTEARVTFTMQIMLAWFGRHSPRVKVAASSAAVVDRSGPFEPVHLREPWLLPAHTAVQSKAE